MNCPVCSGSIAFDLNDAGQSANCPHCQNMVQLKTPPKVSAGFTPYQNGGSVQTRGRDSARMVKGFSALAMIISVPGCGICAESNSHILMGFFGLMFLAGFAGFVIGRFME